ncbi:MAG: ABC transporter permease [Clostridiales bacterium]|nr:ABC transporter permease [Clostridiales bacterium]
MKSRIKSRARELFLLTFILLVCVINTSLSDGFLTFKNIMNILKANTVYGIMALGMTMVITTGNVDVSVGVSIVGTGVIAAKLAILELPEASPYNPILAMLVAICAGVLIGAFNGFFVSYVKIPSLMITLGSFSMIRGILCLVTGGRWITGFPGWFISFANTKILSVYIGVLIWLALIVLTSLILAKTNLGRQLLAVGGSASAAMRAGINTKRVVMFAYMYLGALVGLSSILFFSQTGMLDPMLGDGYEMTVIAAVIIGGTMLSGGIASVAGTVLGILVLGVINSMLVFAHIPVYWQKLFTGALLLIAVISSYVKHDGKKKRTRAIVISG